MKILKEQNGTQLRLECIGKLDAASAPAFREEISGIDLTQYGKVDSVRLKNEIIEKCKK